jgi:ribosomal protein S18 acetylase RimI-like enzyme
MIRNTYASDAAAIRAILSDSGQFDADGLDFVHNTLDQHLTGHGDAIWLTADDGEPVGVAYCASEVLAPGVWNLLMLWTRADRRRAGQGAALVHQVESVLHERAARLLLVETSGQPGFAAARAFYSKLGFSHEATIRNYFAPGDDKLVYTKALQ